MDFMLGVAMASPNEPVLLYAHPSMHHLALQIAAKCGSYRSQEKGDAARKIAKPLLSPDITELKHPVCAVWIYMLSSMNSNNDN